MDKITFTNRFVAGNLYVPNNKQTHSFYLDNRYIIDIEDSNVLYQVTNPNFETTLKATLCIDSDLVILTWKTPYETINMVIDTKMLNSIKIVSSTIQRIIFNE